VRSVGGNGKAFTSKDVRKCSEGILAFRHFYNHVFIVSYGMNKAWKFVFCEDFIQFMTL